ncbi:hypothetical protein BDU57DRAFT_435581 [Ampelomyces quisqualis]|uniref:J domain-containing protein n=1 Tax=Ampelomyces quisqualis TaxID=50730 RepID=A0A6A5R3K5_AMPQU|nr:hypothetical protein BDU57DRAFT_435581 [Ampelomyces quisqualis]
MRTHYDVLRVAVTASDADIKLAYRKLALTHHPDRTLHLTDAERADREKTFKLATNANEILSDPLRRAAYDRATRATRPAAQTRPTGQAHIPWFYAPVSSDASTTTLNYASHCGWSFSVSLSAKYAFARRPVLPLLQADTRAEISVEIHLSRDRTASLSDTFGRDCTVNVIHTPGGRQTALSSMLVELRNGEMALRISLATAMEEVPSVLSPLACMYTWAFDMDMGFLAPFYSTARVTCLMFWPYFPAQAVGEGGGVPEQEPWPVGSPMAAVKMACGDVRFEKLSKKFYCAEQTWGTKKFWRLAAVGSA